MTIAVVGIGLDGAEGLNFAVRKIIEEANILVGSKRHLAYFPDHSGKRIYLTNFKLGIEQIDRCLKLHESIVVLASGDPLFFGIGRLLLANFSADEIQFHPHISSIQLGFSKLKIPWQDAYLISLHGRSNDELIKLLKQGVKKIALLTDSQNHPGAIARLYLALDLPVDYSFFIGENLGAINEHITEFTPQQIEELSTLESHNFASLNILILIRQSQESSLDLNRLPLIGLPDRSFLTFRDRPSLITKKEVRLAILGELSLQPSQVVWDIGAGTGSVSIEIARMCPSSQVIAIEKTAIGANLITQNSQRFKVNNITCINGKAPDTLSSLSNPHRVFIGGSGGDANAILEVCQQKLLDGGKIVMSFATIEHGYQAINWFQSNSWDYRLLQLHISRSIPINHLTRMTPLNPVTIITASAPKNNTADLE